MLTSFDIVIRPAVIYQSRTISPFFPPSLIPPLSTFPAYRSNKGIQFDPDPLVYRTTAKPPQIGRIMDFLSRVCDVMFMEKPMKKRGGERDEFQPFWTSPMENGLVSPRFKAVTVS